MESYSNEISSKNEALSFFAAIKPEDSKLKEVKVLEKGGFEGQFTYGPDGEFQIFLLTQAETASGIYQNFCDSMTSKFSKNISEEGVWKFYFDITEGLTGGISDLIPVDGMYLFIFTMNANNKDVFNSAQTIKEKCAEPTIGQQISEKTSRLTPTYLGPILVACGLLFEAYIIITAQDNVFSFGRYGHGIAIPNFLSASIFIFMAVLALARKVKFIYYFLTISVVVTFIQSLMVFSRLSDINFSSGSTVIAVDFAISIFLLILIPLRAKDFGCLNARHVLYTVGIIR